MNDTVIDVETLPAHDQPAAAIVTGTGPLPNCRLVAGMSGLFPCDSFPVADDDRVEGRFMIIGFWTTLDEV